MKKVLIISVALAVLFPVLRANAITVQNISTSDTGGVSSYGKASASGGEDASAEVYSVIRSDGSETNVRIDIRTNEDGVENATSVFRTLEGNERMETRAATGEPTEVRVDIVGSAEFSESENASTTTKVLDQAFGRFTSFFARIFNLVFSFW